jgi:hypothetical protein
LAVLNVAAAARLTLVPALESLILVSGYLPHPGFAAQIRPLSGAKAIGAIYAE